MTHPTEFQLICLARDELTSEERQAVQAHLDACDACRRQYLAMAEVNDLLGAWETNAADRDLSARIRSRVDGPRLPIIAAQRNLLRQAARIAAAIVLAIGVGHIVGRIARPGSLAEPVAIAEASEADIVDELGLYVLESPASAGLFTTVLDIAESTEAADGEEVER